MLITSDINHTDVTEEQNKGQLFIHQLGMLILLPISLPINSAVHRSRKDRTDEMSTIESRREKSSISFVI